MTEFVTHIVKGIVDDASAVEVRHSREREGQYYLVTVDPNDVGKMIGKHGRVINAIRSVVSAGAAKNHQKAYVKINAD